MPYWGLGPLARWVPCADTVKYLKGGTDIFLNYFEDMKPTMIISVKKIKFPVYTSKPIS